MLPTRDLVIQVRETFEAIAKGRGLKAWNSSHVCLPSVTDGFPLLDSVRYWPAFILSRAIPARGKNAKVVMSSSREESLINISGRTVSRGAQVKWTS